MLGRIRARVALLVALAALTAVIVPAGLAIGSHDSATVAGGDPSVVLLTLKKGNGDQAAWVVDGTTVQTQSIGLANNNCLTVNFAASPDLLEVNAHGGALGHVKEGFGVKSASDGGGEPCGRIEASDGESLSVSLGSSLDGYLMSAIDVDLEVKFNALVEVTFLHDDSVVDVATVPQVPGSDDGPDSSDNIRFAWRPGVDGDGGGQKYFDTVLFTPIAGSFSLEGGQDAPFNGSLLAGNRSSQFEVVQTFDGQITCGDDVGIGSEGSLVSTYGTLTLHAMDLDSTVATENEWLVAECLMKLYNAEAGIDALSFNPLLEDTGARYTLEVTVPNQPIVVAPGPTPPAGTITSLIAEYWTSGSVSFPPSSTLPVQACQGAPITDDSDPDYASFWSQDSPVQVLDPMTMTMIDLLPPGESFCFYSASVTPTGAGVGTEQWGFYFEDDPIVRFK